MSSMNNSVATGLLQAFGDDRPDTEILARPAAAALYERVSRRSRAAEAFAALLGRPLALLDLEASTVGLRIHAQHYLGRRDVPIKQIRGSEGRIRDFDSRFRPLRKHTRQRWLDVALAWELGIALPPVELIRVGEI